MCRGNMKTLNLLVPEGGLGVKKVQKNRPGMGDAVLLAGRDISSSKLRLNSESEW